MPDKVKIGDVAPDFTLVDTERKPHRLSEFRGKNVVLAFYPGAFTSVCKKEMCTFRDSLGRLEGLEAQVVGVSVNDPWSNTGFKETNMLNFPLLSDYNREVIKLYGIVLENFAGLRGYNVAKRSVFVLDKDGVVRYRWVSEDPGVEPNYKEIEGVLGKISSSGS